MADQDATPAEEEGYRGSVVGGFEGLAEGVGGGRRGMR